jgi:ABC-2 type transport system ATP-binding protein
MIRINNLSKSFGSLHVLKNICMDFEKGRVYGIVGDNGAGKTTLFRCIAGFESYEGEVKCNLNPLKNHLGWLPTEPFLFPKITGKEYLQLLGNARHQKIQSFDELNVFDLPLNQYASTYSTGMKKKLALTALLLQKNEVFILDEPFNGVDIQSNILLTAIIQKLKEHGRTVIISSHIFSTLSDTCDSISLLKHGDFTRIVQRPDFADLEIQLRETIIGTRLDHLSF